MESSRNTAADEAYRIIEGQLEIRPDISMTLLSSVQRDKSFEFVYWQKENHSLIIARWAFSMSGVDMGVLFHDDAFMTFSAKDRARSLHMPNSDVRVVRKPVDAYEALFVDELSRYDVDEGELTLNDDELHPVFQPELSVLESQIVPTLR